MKERIRRLYHAMIAWDAGNPELIQHFTKVHSYAVLIAESEGLDAHTAEVLEAAALVHDIAIPLCDQKYGAHPGPKQEKEGPPLAFRLLKQVGGFTEEEITRVCTLVGEHHSFDRIDGIDHQILIEADFLVNSYENGLAPNVRRHVWRHVFATKAGKEIYAAMFGLTE